MRKLLAISALLALATPAAAQDAAADAKAADLEFPAGWQIRLDRPNANVNDVRFFVAGDGLHATTGPAAIFWHPDNVAEGEFGARATFIQMKPSRHPEAYGIFVGGRDLDGDAQDYFYFLIRQDGKFLVKHRAGAETHTIIDWTAHEAVRPAGDDGRATNTLEMRVRAGDVRFLVNGVEVAKLDRVPYLNTDGIVGLRVNHNLDVHIDGFGFGAPRADD